VTAVVVDNAKDSGQALDDLQTTLEKYATDQGFTIE